MTQTNTEEFIFKIDMEYLKEEYIGKQYKNDLSMNINYLKNEIEKSIPFVLKLLDANDGTIGSGYARMIMKLSNTPICKDIYLMLNNPIMIKTFKEFIESKFGKKEVVVTDVTVDTNTGIVITKYMLLTEFEKNNKNVKIVTYEDIVKSLHNVTLNNEGEE